MDTRDKNYEKNWLGVVLALILCLLVRLIPFRAPNIEPILATQMPFSKVYGAYTAALFAFLSIVIYDTLTSGIGVWTWITAVAYGLVGFWATAYFKNRESTRANYVKFAIVSTIAFDVVTGFTVGPIFFNQPFFSAVVGQIPFTLLHLLGNVAF